VQTFLPYNDFEASAFVLDNKRLGKQRVETFQILNAIRHVDKFGDPLPPATKRGWVTHPCTVMWRNYVPALALYGYIMTCEWIDRGYNDTLLPKFQAVLDVGDPIVMPAWLGLQDLHVSHQSNLMRKHPDHYSKYFASVPDTLPYVWPK